MPPRSDGPAGRGTARTATRVPPEAQAPADRDGGRHAGRAAALEEERFGVDVSGFTGQLDELVAAARRGDVDLSPISVSAITARFRERLAGVAEPDAQQLAGFLDQASRLVALKASRLIPDSGIDLEPEDRADETGPVDDPGSRLADGRLFRAAVDQVLAGATGEPARSFLARTLTPEAVPTETLSISQERLVGALRGALARLPKMATVSAPAPATAVSVDARCAAVRGLLAERDPISLDELFTTATSRLEAIATFLALLEMLKRGEIRVEPDATGVVVVSAATGMDAPGSRGRRPWPSRSHAHLSRARGPDALPATAAALQAVPGLEGAGADLTRPGHCSPHHQAAGQRPSESSSARAVASSLWAPASSRSPTLPSSTAPARERGWRRRCWFSPLLEPPWSARRSPSRAGGLLTLSLQGLGLRLLSPRGPQALGHHAPSLSRIHYTVMGDAARRILRTAARMVRWITACDAASLLALSGQ
jgi:segregation and condensation protein A